VTVQKPADVTQIRLTEAVAGTIRREASRSIDGNETGGILFGHLHPDGTAEVRHAGDAGPAAVRTPTFFLRDLGHAQALATAAFARDGSGWIGEWHTHPSISALPSARDLETYLSLLSDPQLAFDVIAALILTAGADGWHSPATYGWACYPDRAEAVPVIIARHEAGNTTRAETDQREHTT
jgi:integrative and conjugative element protein (TIGR02256 family)